MKILFLPFLLSALLLTLPGVCGVRAAVPIHNPVLDFFDHDPSLAWTEEIAWHRVFVITDFAGDTDMERYLAARDAAWSAGGGVVFFPAGVYHFEQDLVLRDHVILRGEDPIGQTDARELDYTLSTRFEFPRYVPSFEGSGTPNNTAFRFIGTLNPANDSNIGLVNIDINRAGIAMASGGTGARNRLVFGVRSNNVAAAQANIPRDYQHPWQRHSWRFVSNIQLYAYENVLIANNRVNDKHYTVSRQLPGWETVEIDDFEQPGYIVDNQSGGGVFTALEGHQAVFSYTNHYGIRARGSSGLWGALPHQQPNLYHDNIQILNNWVFNTMRVGFMVSGDNLVVRGNVKRDHPGKAHWMHPDGHRLVQNAATLENRGIDFAGGSILIEDNDIQVERHHLRLGAYYSVDGEGIMIQEIHGSMVDSVTIRNNTTNAYIGIWKMPYTRNLQIIGNTLTRRSGLTSDHAYIFVEADTNNLNRPLFNVLIEDNDIVYSGTIRVRGLLGGSNVVVRNNRGNGGQLRFSDFVQHSDNVGFNPSIQIFPSNGTISTFPEIDLLMHSETVLTTGDSVELEVVVSGAVPVEQVEFYANNVALATLTEPPYTLSWQPEAGRYQLSAIARPVDTANAWFSVSSIQRVEVLTPFAHWLRTAPPAHYRLAHVRLFGEHWSLLERFAFSLPLAEGAVAMGSPRLVSQDGLLSFSVRHPQDLATLGVRLALQWSETLEDWFDLSFEVPPDGFEVQGEDGSLRLTVPAAGSIFIRTQLSVW